ncbi:MAG: BamA/TamA family outer membrane protein [Chitinophagaceae bacterium]
MRQLLLLLFALLCISQTRAQLTDSVTVAVHPSYNNHGKLHRFLFGEGYRKEWAAPTTLPLIHISTFHGGLRPLQLGGGMQSKSLRLIDKDGMEWIVRSVEKTPDSLLPFTLRQTFARDWLDDVTSSQHPFSALVVPPIANATGVAHSNPIIGVLASDTALGIYNSTFANLVVLLEEREPAGESDNTAKMIENLQADNDNRLDGVEVLRARMLDLFIGDWDRHEDQFRFYDGDKTKGKLYVAVPRDRDQVFHVTQGIIPKIASRDYILPTLRNFDGDISHSKWYLYKTRFFNAYPSAQLSRTEWKELADEFTAAATDSVLEVALSRLPKASWDIRHDELLQKLKSRRSRLPQVFDNYYVYSHKIADLRLSNKNELVELKTLPDGGLNLRIFKLNKNGKAGDQLMNQDYEARMTKEIRIYLSNGNDSVVTDTKDSKIDLRIIGGEGSKNFTALSDGKKIRLYNRPGSAVMHGDSSIFRKHTGTSANYTSFTPVNLDNIWIPLFQFGVNLDDGLILGGGFRYLKQEGFRRYPYASSQQLTAAHSFSTNAYRINYKGEWIGAVGKADLLLDLYARAPNNTVNFFGRGNTTTRMKGRNFIRFYRTRFSTYLVDPAIRWRGKKAQLSVGPSMYLYRFDAEDNKGRLITNPALIGSYDSLLIDKDKLHLGAGVHYVVDNRDNKIITRSGYYLDVWVKAYRGVSNSARDFGQLVPEFAVYTKLNKRGTIIVADRVGGTISVGKTTFYQSAFIGGQGNLLGYRQYRFAGQHSAYNNLELRIKLADIVSYILPGQFGITGLWDIGRVWEKSDKSGKWHNGTGAGIYFAPASMISFNFVMGYSTEGWLPYFTLGMRF